MKKLFLSMLMMGSLMANAQDIKLPAPDMTQKSMSVVDALATRHSVREYSNQELTNQEISNLCWAACGVSRDDAHRTAPTAMNRKEIRLFVFTAANVYEYIATENLLKQVATGDQRKLIAAGQAFAQTAPVSLLMVIDFDLFGGNNERSVMMGCVDAGNVSENINLYCQAVGMATVPRATHDTNGLKQLLNLSDNQMPIMNNPVGFPK
ncbi:MAG: nitroreductase family protein [Bacteroidaceae bacterium]|nr:nitroreductase family protein [Bacteroidaceae bacterium]